MTENYEEELKLIGLSIYNNERSKQYTSYFNPAHMRQRIEREMEKDARLAEQEARIKELEGALGIVRSMADYTNAGDNIALYIDSSELLK